MFNQNDIHPLAGKLKHVVDKNKNRLKSISPGANGDLLSESPVNLITGKIYIL